jgi:hypothetical protein
VQEKFCGLHKFLRLCATKMELLCNRKSTETNHITGKLNSKLQQIKAKKKKKKTKEVRLS